MKKYIKIIIMTIGIYALFDLISFIAISLGHYNTDQNNLCHQLILFFLIVSVLGEDLKEHDEPTE